LPKTKLREARNTEVKRYIIDACNYINNKIPVSVGGHVLVRGNNIKIMGDFPECGVWLHDRMSGEKLKVDHMAICKTMSNFAQSPRTPLLRHDNRRLTPT
jgi:hypothetical protein